MIDPISEATDENMPDVVRLSITDPSHEPDTPLWRDRNHSPPSTTKRVENPESYPTPEIGGDEKEAVIGNDVKVPEFDGNIGSALGTNDVKGSDPEY
jgi:hypothetical protein